METRMASLLLGRTAVVIAHWVTTAMHADRVVLLDHSRVVQSGPRRLLSLRGRMQ